MDELIPKLKNFWYYHKYHLLIALLAAAALAYMLWPSKAPSPDYTVGIVTALPCSQERLEEIEARISRAGEDLNGDGQVLVQLRPFTVDFESADPNSGYNNYEKISALDADLVGKVSGLYLAEAPEAFQEATNGLLAEPFVPFDGVLSIALRKDAPAEYAALCAALE